jgi:hypothetical protein
VKNKNEIELKKQCRKHEPTKPEEIHASIRTAVAKLLDENLIKGAADIYKQKLTLNQRRQRYKRGIKKQYSKTK